MNKNDSDLSPDDIAVSPLVHGVVERMRGLTRLIPATDEGNSEISGEKTVHAILGSSIKSSTNLTGCCMALYCAARFFWK